eukprot:evm.model.scf_688.7 EVM.evm.TU.scf_688.7   scf_688:35808-39260(+)
MVGHQPYIMPDGQPLSRYLTLDGEGGRKGPAPRRRRKGPRGKDEMWTQLMSQQARLRDRSHTGGLEAAELEAVGRVGHRRRRRWLNDKLLRDMAGPMTAAEMESHFKPPPFGYDSQPSVFCLLKGSGGLWDALRNIDMDKQWRLLQELEDLVRSQKDKKRRKERPAQVALKKWGAISRLGRQVLKHANPHTVLELEMPILDFKDQEGCDEELTLETDNLYARQLIISLAQFHSLKSSTGPKAKGSDVHALTLRHKPEAVLSEHSDKGQVPQLPSPLEITCTDVLLAMQEYQHIGLNDRLLEEFVVTQIHGLGEEREYVHVAT